MFLNNLKEEMIGRVDELGTAGKGFDSTVQYLQEMADIANRIASGDLTVKVILRSEKDELGIAFSQMISSLQSLILMVAQSAQLNYSRRAAGFSLGTVWRATRQIAITIQQVALGIAQQTASVTRTSGSVGTNGTRN